MHPDANLFDPPPPVTGKKVGRPRKKGAKAPAPQEAGRWGVRTRLNVGWYGGQRRDVEVVSGQGHWYKAGVGLVADPCGSSVHDLSGTHRDEYFYTTDPTLTATAIEAYTNAEHRNHLPGDAFVPGPGDDPWPVPLETVLRAEPCLFGLYSVVTLLYEQLPEQARAEPGVEWVGKAAATFSDAITAVRRWLWSEWVLEQADSCGHLCKITRAVAADAAARPAASRLSRNHDVARLNSLEKSLSVTDR